MWVTTKSIVINAHVTNLTLTKHLSEPETLWRQDATGECKLMQHSHCTSDVHRCYFRQVHRYKTAASTCQQQRPRHWLKRKEAKLKAKQRSWESTDGQCLVHCIALTAAEAGDESRQDKHLERLRQITEGEKNSGNIAEHVTHEETLLPGKAIPTLN